MRAIPPPHGNDPNGYGDRLTGWPGFVRPTWSKLLRAALTVGFVLVLTTLLVIPAVFSVVPIGPNADALTICVPGIGPLQRFADDLEGEREELVFLHEGVHAEQCRTLGAPAFARSVATPRRRLALEAQALCAEAELLTLRGADPARLVERTVETLASEYFPDGSVALPQIAVAVAGACGAVLGDARSSQ